jgi:hypothetical protein
MKSAILPSFWEKYRALSPAVRAGARKAYRLWAENPFHPSLHFKCIDSKEDIWSGTGYEKSSSLECDDRRYGNLVLDW